LVAYSATTNLFGFVQTWSKWCRQRLPQVMQICGGIHPTLNRDSSLLTSELDAVCVGEGEWPMIELCDHLQRGKLPYNSIDNLTFKDSDGDLHRNPVRPQLTEEELNHMPYADRFLFDLENICDPNRPIVIASRGCPYNCTYCCNRALLDVVGKANAIRVRSVENVLGEIKHIREIFPFTDGIHFDDDIFGMKIKWMREFMVAYRDRVALPFSCNMRPNLAGAETVRLLADAGCDEVAMGVETGNPELRKLLLDRKMDDQVLIDVYRRFEEAGVSAHSYNMVGVPHEKMENSLETIKLNARLKKKWKMNELRITIFYPYAGTPLLAEAEKHDMLTDRCVTHYADDTTLNLDTMTGDQIRFAARYFRPLVMIYKKLLFEWGVGGRIAAKVLDRFLLSKFSEKLVFPAANRIYPAAVKLVRWLKIYESKQPAKQIIPIIDEAEVVDRALASDALRPVLA
ncbi:MAG: radical SAM protein, partial [Planctomycetes bacterium]|nr:radical SAM protein [Planctomycetota bacterium]